MRTQFAKAQGLFVEASPHFIVIRFPVIEPHRLPWSCGETLELGLPVLGGWMSPQALSPHWRSWRLGEDLLAWCCAALGQCGQGVAAPPALCGSLSRLSGGGEWGASAPLPCSRILSVVSCPLELLAVLVKGSEVSRPMSPSWWWHSYHIP